MLGKCGWFGKKGKASLFPASLGDPSPKREGLVKEGRDPAFLVKGGVSVRDGRPFAIPTRTSPWGIGYAAPNAPWGICRSWLCVPFAAICPGIAPCRSILFYYIQKIDSRTKLLPQIQYFSNSGRQRRAKINTFLKSLLNRFFLQCII